VDTLQGPGSQNNSKYLKISQNISKLEVVLVRRVQDKNVHVFGGAALLRRPRVQGRAAALPYQEGEDFCPAPWSVDWRVWLVLRRGA
jgi:hypothetical protein